MYQEYFGLAEKPFSETPNPKFLYLSAKHREGLAHLEYNILDGKGFTVLVGEVGAGKTTLCRALMDRLDSEKVTVVHIIHTNLDFHEFLREVVDELGISSQGQQKWDLLKALNQYLIEGYGQNRKVVLIVDEAQNLTPSVLEGIRMLSNLETPSEKLLQIVFVGQPGLLEHIQRADLLQLRQRIAGSYYLGPLTEKETQEYILFRLDRVQSKPVLRFTPEAISMIYRVSGGIPRLINFLCDSSLMEAYVAESWTVDIGLVQKAFKELTGAHELEKQSGGREKKFSRKIQGIRRGDELEMTSSLGSGKSPEIPIQNADWEEAHSEKEENFLFPEKRSLMKRMAVALSLALTLGGLGSILFWEANPEQWSSKRVVPAYQIKMPVADLGSDRHSRVDLSEKNPDKMTQVSSD